MRFSSFSFAIAASLVVSVTALPRFQLPTRELESRAPEAIQCIQLNHAIGVLAGKFSPACANITKTCLSERGTSIWSHESCVAAAACQGTKSIIGLNQCQNPEVKDAASIPNLSFAVYTSIVGSCAPSGCPMTKQNFIDFLYGQMSAAGVTEWPKTVEEVTDSFLKPILNWAKTGDTIPYTNFNDWLHFSSL
ncbi:hypothetical protein MIND_00971100 [Mycena indigotica]|uniref:Uncharacterized protein n=1 Tax=Mycena indigotica TaxID=2126181 RepID=A0A8H6VZC3_9AGAR|nr:uncharacterized protein MIND_00971100 [Mycena indigotica]KAF7297376.1 hypothetical protein MIND_00971100 [Mycena indigotica]